MDLEVHKTRLLKICQVRMVDFVGTSNPQVAGSIPAEGANRGNFPVLNEALTPQSLTIAGWNLRKMTSSSTPNMAPAK